MYKFGLMKSVWNIVKGTVQLGASVSLQRFGRVPPTVSMCLKLLQSKYILHSMKKDRWLGLG